VSVEVLNTRRPSARSKVILGAYDVALVYSQLALEHLEAEYGSLHYGLSLANRCHTYLLMGREYEANLDFQKALSITHVEVQGALEVLTRMRSGNIAYDDAFNHPLIPTWRERYQEFLKNAGVSGGQFPKLSELEQKVVGLLSKEPMSKHSLIQEIYGIEIDFFAAENRLKNLLNRLRQKIPGSFIFSDGHYRLVDASPLLVRKS